MLCAQHEQRGRRVDEVAGEGASDGFVEGHPHGLDLFRRVFVLLGEAEPAREEERARRAQQRRGVLDRAETDELLRLDP